MSCCNNTIRITKITTTSTGVILIPARTITQTNLTDTGKYNLIIGCGLKATASLPVFIQTSVGNVPVLTRFGNVVYANQLRTRYRYVIGYGNNNTTPYPLGQFILLNKLCCCACPSATTVTQSADVVVEKKTK